MFSPPSCGTSPASNRATAGFEALHGAQQRLPDDSTRDWFNAQFGTLQGIREAPYPDLRLEPHRSDYGE
ncbi:hypothetical protein [Sinomonas sp. B1-1]|uniref:hypothetical protein n=1 Tax=Sinomonas sp. B1-1 TaxID=3141454 RepID=UPI003D2AB0AD